ncbi:hypothetical protein VNO77_42928 [Canavalia gladiata]|uniref:Uncharacterized protein n=1 Tax=Canavalia gladiata TaxID=3824 RepID=A0AAN9PP07_CANGL
MYIDFRRNTSFYDEAFTGGRFDSNAFGLDPKVNPPKSYESERAISLFYFVVKCDFSCNIALPGKIVWSILDPSGTGQIVGSGMFLKRRSNLPCKNGNSFVWRSIHKESRMLYDGFRDRNRIRNVNISFWYDRWTISKLEGYGFGWDSIISFTTAFGLKRVPPFRMESWYSEAKLTADLGCKQVDGCPASLYNHMQGDAKGAPHFRR